MPPPDLGRPRRSQSLGRLHRIWEVEPLTSRLGLAVEGGGVKDDHEGEEDHGLGTLPSRG
jgi:hypothetical protein